MTNSEKIENFIEDLYNLRQIGISREGESDLFNLVFKEFRNLGYLDNLKELRKQEKGKELSLEGLKEEIKETNHIKLTSQQLHKIMKSLGFEKSYKEWGYHNVPGKTLAQYTKATKGDYAIHNYSPSKDKPRFEVWLNSRDAINNDEKIKQAIIDAGFDVEGQHGFGIVVIEKK